MARTRTPSSQMMCTKILAQVVEGALALTADLEPVLRDILVILASKVRAKTEQECVVL